MTPWLRCQLVHAQHAYQNILVFERSPWSERWFLLLLGAMLICLDKLLLPYLVFPLFFIFPVMLAAWNWGFSQAGIYGVFLGLTRYICHLLSQDFYFNFHEFFNVLARLLVLLLLAWLVAVIAKLTHQLRQRVQQLEGMLPICASCKAIRDGQGNWKRLENYIAEHSAASFTHGLCPECVQRLSGEVMQNPPPEGRCNCN